MEKHANKKDKKRVVVYLDDETHRKLKQRKLDADSPGLGEIIRDLLKRPQEIGQAS